MVEAKRWLLTAMTVASLAGGLGCSGVSDGALDLVGRSAPVARLTLIDGEDVSIESFRGRHTAILFWATWCRHSRSAIEDFAEIAQTYARRRDLAFVAVNVDRADNLDRLKERIREQNLGGLTHVFSGNDLQDEAYLAFRGDVVPYLVVVDPRGTVRAVDTSLSTLEDYLEELPRR